MEKELTRQEQEELFLKVYAEKGTQKEAAEAVGWDKSKAWRFIKKLKEKEPERLKGATTGNKDKTEIITANIIESEKQESQVIPIKIVEAAQKPQETFEQIQLIKSTPQATQKPQTVFELKKPIETISKEEANTKPQKATMGFRAEVSKIEFWRAYADATDTELGIMCTAAIDEYIQRHELTADQKEIIDIKMEALEKEKLIRAKINMAK